jgi:hypothetical protein
VSVVLLGCDAVETSYVSLKHWYLPTTSCSVTTENNNFNFIKIGLSVQKIFICTDREMV